LESGVTDGWEEFASKVASRLEKGRQTYGGWSFSRSPGQLLDEVEEEILDVCGWSYILWTRLRTLRQRLESETEGAVRQCGDCK
jgi:hypothetical protein